MKIAFVISTFSAGGAERVASLLCNQWVAAGHDVHLCLFQGKDIELFYPVDEKIHLHQLDVMSVASNKINMAKQFLNRVLSLKETLEEIKPDIVFSFLTETNVAAILAARMAHTPIIVSERVHPQYHKVGSLKNLARKLSYNFADQVTVQSEDIKAWFSQKLKLETKIIPNPIASVTSFSRKTVLSERKKLVAMGRLEKQKGFDHLISTFISLQNEFPDWDLKIYGTGSLRDDFQRKINEAHISDRITLEGVTTQVNDVFAHADVFVHTAQYEGFPNVIVEALANGCCVVATKSPGALRDILNDGKFGILCEHQELENALSKTMSNPNLRVEMRAKAQEAVKRYDLALVADMWLEEASKVIEKSKEKNKS
ncbi:putative Glycosyl transferase group 1 [Candidatus Terasakiella magnetica]|uniref:Putative Glycosyl transferase group 1 n=1 Tax=Candidatus Terasakiella magnetica TaxID=1867952 RepID=A0A1C3RG37_9PROT|nr:glycosyltransferase family 4 protein [Candidatus Terasakiella magnetica]SCA56215.1 putative Glycosyl transferase group 1 [Candidatus Terasakiella magnetica]